MRWRKNRPVNPVYKVYEDVNCCECGKYKENNMWLTGPCHYPFNASANYHCDDCLDSDAVKSGDALA